MYKCETTPTPPPHPPPPVPPRRRKKKIINAGTPPREEEKQEEVKVRICAKRIDRKRLPPPPPPFQIPRKNKTKLVDKNQIQTRIIIHEPSPKVYEDEQSEIVSLDYSSNSENNVLKTGDASLKKELRVDEKPKKELTMSCDKNYKVDEDPKRELKVNENERPKQKLKVYESPKRELKVSESVQNDFEVDEDPKSELKVNERPESDLKIYESPKRGFKVDERPTSELKVGESPLKEFNVSESSLREFKVSESPLKEFKVAESPLREFKVAESPKRNVKNNESPKNYKPSITSPRYGDIVRKQEFNKYPPLFFTLDDLQNVITDNPPIENRLEESRIEENVIRNVIEKELNVEDEVTNDSFIDNNITDENEICFRVTPTNFPFEKCLERWKTSLEDNAEFGIDERNSFIFEDYIDRSNRLNIRRSRSPMCYDILETDGNIIEEHTATKVRFVIESPSSSTPEFDSLPNIDSILNEETSEQPINNLQQNQNIEARDNADLFGDIPFGSLLQNNNDEKSEVIYSVNLFKENFESENKGEQDEDRSNKFSYNTISLPSENCFTEKEMTVGEFEVERSLSQKLSGELESSKNNSTNSNANNNNNKSVDYIRENNNQNTVNILEDENYKPYSPKRSNTNERRKIFVTQAVRSFMNDDSLVWDESDEEDEEFIDQNSLKLEIVKEDKSQDSSVTRIEELKGGSILSVPSFEESIDKIVDDSMSKESCSNGSCSVPVSVRRNSFLETMLSDGENQANWNTQGYCEIVAIHPKNDHPLVSLEEINERDSNLQELKKKKNRCNKEENDKNSLKDKQKDIVDVKSNVLNELLSNFATIKLRSVVEEKKVKEDSVNLKNVEFVFSDKKDKVEEAEIVVIKGKKNDVADEDARKITTNQMAVQRIQAEIKESRQLDKQMKKSKSQEKISVSDLNLTYLRDTKDRSKVVKNIDDNSVHEIVQNEMMNKKMIDNLEEEEEEVCRNDLEEIDFKKKKNDTEDSADKCAIVREKTPIVITHRNNDDNNRAITTPVDLSNDQSLADHDENLTIIPGSVRNFVKYYEIRQETTAFEDSKINDRKTLVRSKEERSNVSNKIKNFEFKEQLKAARQDCYAEYKEGKINEKKDDCSLMTGPESLTNEISYTVIVKKIAEPNEMKMECGESSLVSTNEFNENNKKKSSIKIHRKKSVQFSGEHKMIQVQENHQDDQEASFSQPVQHIPQEVPRTDYQRNSGEELVTVPPSNGGQQQEGWKLQQQQQQRRGGQLQTVNKRTRPTPPVPPPPPLISCKVNAKDIGKYFDWPNKENTPGNALNLIHSKGNNRKGKVFDKKDKEKEEEEEEVGKEEKEEEEEVAVVVGRQGEEEKEEEEKESINEMGSNLSRHNGKGLTGRRTQSSGNLCEPPKGKFNGMGKILVPCSSSSQRESRYKFCGSLPNHLDDKDVLDDERRDNNNIMSDTISGNLGGTLPHKKRSLGVHFSDGGPTGALDLVKHRSQDSLDENDPWRYQQSDLDLVRCRHGNFDSVRRNRSVETMINETSSRRYNRGTSMEDRCQRNSDLDLVGTLPKRKQEIRSILNKGLDTTNSSSSQFVTNKFDVSSSDDDLLMRIVHKPDCELVKHRQQLNKCVDLKLSKLVGATGEPQDQGYASERSPEDEHPPSLPGQPFPSITPESTFRVTLQKSSRGLGLSVSGGGTAGPVRVKRLFPLQPAALSNKLQPGDILLAANGIPLTGLTNYEALEVLRTTPNTVELVVCRLPGDTNVSPPGAPPPPPARREPPPPLRIPNPLPPLQIEPCGEFDIEMLKVGGSLGFTLRKADSSALGHYVRALVREPALSDGRIRPGDKIVAVDGAPLSPMSHEEAVALLRQCGPKVKLRLYRDLAQTPVSALSPTEPDHPLRPPRTCLRQEAVDMLCDLAARKLSPGTSSGSSCLQSPGASCNSPRRHRRLATRTPTADNDQEIPEKFHEGQTTSIGSQAETSDSDQCSIRTQITNSQANTPISNTDIIIDPPSQYHVCESNESPLRTPTRPSFLDLSAPQGKPHFQFCSGDSDEYPVETMLFSEKDSSSFENDYRGKEIRGLSSDEQDTDLPSEPASMPPVLSSTSSTSTAAFSYKNPAYQSANPACGVTIDTASKSKVTHSSDQDIPGKILGTEDPAGSKGLLKWKGVMFAPNDDMNENEKDEKKVDDDNKDNLDSAVSSESQDEQGNEVFMVELTRGWNSRLGFSLKSEDNHTVISVVHPDSVAARDGRLKQGDVLLMVNDESVENMTTAEIIDLLRKIRGSIGITVMRRNKQENNAT
ncbi:PREDICTED: uncharacterized protein LOC107067064 isoform X3 [Polistes dominula]|uniref:Uncharacterized protein LOC107067064 isoform X3 n=1 Tax=Polistes dominula TaxID=743375 RepID=A0ABM1IBX9_POLDO|nr:PREDICTED: uncharacterized protein LOC107067064 isoform X3 [Polistes dominula]